MSYIIENVRTAIRAHDGYLYIPDLSLYVIFEIEYAKDCDSAI